MKKIIFLSLLVTCFTMITFSQSIGIGTTTPNASSILEIKASNKGLLIPRTSTASRTAIVTPAKGLMVYDTTTNSFWYHNGTAWTQIGAAGTGWLLTGNAGTNPAINFIGTTDAQPLVLRVNNVRSGFIDYNTSNTSFGYQALISNSTGNFNTATGIDALLTNSTGNNNTANGSYTLLNNTIGIYNVAMGSDALHNNISGNYNTANGAAALYSNSTGNYNTATGTDALLTNSTGNNNTANGSYTLLNNTIGIYNVAMGSDALHNNISGNYNTANGAAALYSNTSGYKNTALGFASLFSGTTSHNNIAIGDHALFNNVHGYSLVAVGDSALYNNGIGAIDSPFAINNTAVGSKALYSNTAGSFNTANGAYALFSNTTEDFNTANGAYALYHNTAGYSNTANGSDALYSNRTGYENTANGEEALFSNTFGNDNTAVGYNALQSNFTGSFNTALGVNADVVGDNTNSTAIGYGGYVNTSNVVEIGNSSVTNIGGTVGWTVYSDGRFKKSIQPNVPGLSFITQLKPVTYTFDVRGFNKFSGADERLKQKDTGQAKNNAAAINAINEKAINDKEKIVYTGLVAQDVEQAANKIGYNFSGVHKPQNDKDHYGLDYGSFVVPLIRAVQEQQAIIEDQNKKIDLQQQQINALLSDVERLKQKINTPVK